MAVESIYYANEDRKENKKIVADMNATIKEYGKIPILDKNGERVGFVDKRCEITPGWNGIDIMLDEYIADYVFQKQRLISSIELGTMIDTKHENQEIGAVYSITV